MVPIGLSIVSGFLVPPFLTRRFGMEYFGLWNLLNSIIGLTALGGLGIDTALSFFLKENSEVVFAKRMLRYGRLITRVTGAILTILLAVFILSGWGKSLTKLSIDGSTQSLITLYLAIGWAILALQFLPVQGALIGLGKMYLENIFRGLVSGLPVLVIVFVAIFNLNFLTFVVLSFVSLFIVNLGRFFALKRCLNSKKNSSEVDSPAASIGFVQVTKKSFGFFLAGAGILVIQNVDGFVIAGIRSLKEVAEFGLAFRLISLIFGVVMTLNNSLYTEVRADRGNLPVYQHAWKVALAVSVVALLGTSLFIRDFMDIWLGRTIGLSDGTLVLMVVYGFLFTFVNLNTVFANALGASKILAGISAIEAVLHVLLVVIFTKLFGIIGVPLGSIVAVSFSPYILTRFRLNHYDESLDKSGMKKMLGVEIVILTTASLVGFLTILFFNNFYFKGVLVICSGSLVAFVLRKDLVAQFRRRKQLRQDSL